MACVAPQNVALPVPGDVLGGKYSIVRRIGAGGMGVVYEALHLRLRQRLAVKVLRPDACDEEELLERFEREALITAQLRSIHTARIIDVDRLPSGLPYIVLEYLDGQDLEAELLAAGPLPVAEAVDVAIQVATAMSEAHALGIVHRDLKPANLFVCRAGSRRVVKILDFGISRSDRSAPRITGSSACIGTALYAAPEQLRDSACADARSDVWSLGIVLFELLTGRTPFTGSNAEVIARVMVDPMPSPHQLRLGIPADLARVVLLALQRDPARRFQTMEELSLALAPFGLTESTVDTLAGAQPGHMRLGEILVRDGLVSAPDLERAVVAQRRTGQLLGRVLLDLGLVGRADLVAALAKQQGLEGPCVPVEGRLERERADREADTVRGSALATRPTPTLTPTPTPKPTRFARSTWLAVLACLWIASLLAVAAMR